MDANAVEEVVCEAAAGPADTAWSGNVPAGGGPGSDCEVAVIGAGPYGLAAAAHLRTAGVKTLVFGETMGFWRRHMPQGMLLRSPWRGNHIADPHGRLTLDHWAADCGVRAADPVSLEDFIRYGEWYEQRAGIAPDPREVACVAPVLGGYRLRLKDGNELVARRVLMATGLAHQEFRPAEFAELPAELATHSSDHTRLDQFRSRRVAVIGSGQTACEFSVLLKEAGAEVELISRSGIVWTGPRSYAAEEDRGLRAAVRNLLRPPSPIGPFPFNRLINRPGLFRQLPGGLQRTIAGVSLRPTASARLKTRTAGIRLSLRRRVVSFRVQGGTVSLTLDNGATSAVDHILLATGYQTDIAKPGILAAELVAQIQAESGSPLLTAGFESSMPGLHFAGSAAIHTFGPLLRSVWGAGHAARAIARAAVAGRR